MFRRLVRFVMCKEDVIQVIDTLSSYGRIKIGRMKDGQHYYASLYCESRNSQHCLDSILALSREGVLIRGLDIRYRL